MQIGRFTGFSGSPISGLQRPLPEAKLVFGGERSTDDFVTEEDLLVALRRIQSEAEDQTPWDRNEEETVDYRNLKGALVGFEMMRDSAFLRLPGMEEKRQKLEEELPKFRKVIRWFVRQMHTNTEVLLRSERARKQCLAHLNGSWLNLKYLFGTTRPG